MSSRLCLSFDVGLANMAFVVATVDLDWRNCTVLDARCVNLTRFQHDVVSRENCPLHHTNEAHDRVRHFLQEYRDVWEGHGRVDRVFIERQPVCGLNHVESLLFAEFRDRATKVSPNAMHKWLGIGHLDYDARKRATVRRAQSYMRGVRGFHAVRQHDMSDALMVMLFGILGCETRRLRRLRDARLAREREKACLRRLGVTVDGYFEPFRYRPRHASSALVAPVTWAAPSSSRSPGGTAAAFGGPAAAGPAAPTAPGKSPPGRCSLETDTGGTRRCTPPTAVPSVTSPAATGGGSPPRTTAPAGR